MEKPVGMMSLLLDTAATPTYVIRKPSFQSFSSSTNRISFIRLPYLR